MIKQEKSEEMTRQMEEIWRENQDPELQAKKKRKLKLEEELKEKKEDLSL